MSTAENSQRSILSDVLGEQNPFADEKAEHFYAWFDQQQYKLH